MQISTTYQLRVGLYAYENSIPEFNPAFATDTLAFNITNVITSTNKDFNIAVQLNVDGSGIDGYYY